MSWNDQVLEESRAERIVRAMVSDGMQPLQVLRSATSVNADVFGISNTRGRIKPGLWTGIVVVQGLCFPRGEQGPRGYGLI